MNNCKEIRKQFQELTGLVNQFQAGIKNKASIPELKELMIQIRRDKFVVLENIFTTDFYVRLIETNLFNKIIRKKFKDIRIYKSDDLSYEDNNEIRDSLDDVLDIKTVIFLTEQLNMKIMIIESDLN